MLIGLLTRHTFISVQYRSNFGKLCREPYYTLEESCLITRYVPTDDEWSGWRTRMIEMSRWSKKEKDFVRVKNRIGKHPEEGEEP